MHISHVVASLKTYHNMYHNHHVKTIHKLLKLVFIIMGKPYLFRMTLRHLKTIEIIKNIYSKLTQALTTHGSREDAVVVSKPIKFKYVKINNDIIRYKMQ